MYSQFTLNDKAIQLKRLFSSEDSILKPWNACDEIIIRDFYEEFSAAKKVCFYKFTNPLVGLFFPNNEITFIHDSAYDKESIIENIALNASTGHNIKHVNVLEKISMEFDLLFIQTPKQIDEIPFILNYLKNQFTKLDQVIFVSLEKHIAPNLYSVLQNYFERVIVSHGFKKARYITCTGLKKFLMVIKTVEINEHKFSVFPGVFSANKLDIGTRFLLEHLPILESSKILDLASGYGIIGIEFKKRNSMSQVDFLDDQFLAVESSRLSCALNSITDAHFYWDFKIEKKNCYDLVLSNPPFHRDFAVNNLHSIELVKEAYGSLNMGGEYRIVANRHLSMHHVLNKIFKNVVIVASNTKFVVLSAIKL